MRKQRLVRGVPVESGSGRLAELASDLVPQTAHPSAVLS